MTKYALGITSYKDESSKDKTPEQVVVTVYRELIEKYFSHAIVEKAWGIYKGQKEPSAYVSWEGEPTPEQIVAIKKFLRKYKQESALLYSFTSDSPAIEFQTDNVDKLQKEIIEFTNGRFGEFMTYLPRTKKAFILCVKDFGMNCEEFQKQALLVAHKFHGKLFKTSNQVIT